MENGKRRIFSEMQLKLLKNCFRKKVLNIIAINTEEFNKYKEIFGKFVDKIE